MKSLTAPWICGLLFLATASCSSSGAPSEHRSSTGAAHRNLRWKSGGGRRRRCGRAERSPRRAAGNRRCSASGQFRDRWSTPGWAVPRLAVQRGDGRSPTGGTIVGRAAPLTGGSTVATVACPLAVSLRTGGSAIVGDSGSGGSSSTGGVSNTGGFRLQPVALERAAAAAAGRGRGGGIAGSSGVLSPRAALRLRALAPP